MATFPDKGRIVEHGEGSLFILSECSVELNIERKKQGTVLRPYFRTRVGSRGI